MPNTPGFFDNLVAGFLEFAVNAILNFGYIAMIFCYGGLALVLIVVMIHILVQIARSIKDSVKKYRNRSNNCGDGAPEKTEMEVVKDKKQEVTKRKDKDKESFVSEGYCF